MAWVTQRVKGKTALWNIPEFQAASAFRLVSLHPGGTVEFWVLSTILLREFPDHSGLPWW